VFDWTQRGTLIALALWLVLLATGVVVYVRGDTDGAFVVATIGFFLAPFFMVLGGRSR
jgi:EamA domain-containing membrane protein RarD